jgi:hypothetical protein
MHPMIGQRMRIMIGQKRTPMRQGYAVLNSPSLEYGRLAAAVPGQRAAVGLG